MFRFFECVLENVVRNPSRTYWFLIKSKVTCYSPSIGPLAKQDPLSFALNRLWEPVRWNDSQSQAHRPNCHHYPSLLCSQNKCHLCRWACWKNLELLAHFGIPHCCSWLIIFKWNLNKVVAGYSNAVILEAKKETLKPKRIGINTLARASGFLATVALLVVALLDLTRSDVAVQCLISSLTVWHLENP